MKKKKKRRNMFTMNMFTNNCQKTTCLLETIDQFKGVFKDFKRIKIDKCK